jgi:serine/threonine protein kinase
MGDKEKEPPDSRPSGAYLPYSPKSEEKPEFDDSTPIEDFLKIVDAKQGGNFVEPGDIELFKKQRIKQVGMLRTASKKTWDKLDLPGALEDAIKELLFDEDLSRKLMESFTQWFITTKRKGLDPHELEDIKKIREEAVAAFANVKIIPYKDLRSLKVIEEASTGLNDVFQATWKDVKVCIKLPKTKITRDEFHEYKVIAQLERHAHVIPLLGVSCDFMNHLSRVCLVTPYLAGGALSQLYQLYCTKFQASVPDQKLKEKLSQEDPERKNVAQALFSRGLEPIVLDMALGISHLHSQDPPVVHRDIAARNFLVDSDGKVVVSDFGLSRELKQAEPADGGEQQYAMHKPHSRLPVRWMAPETIQDGVYNTRSDVWSFGVTMWELAHSCHLLPYKDMDNPSVMRALQDGKVIPLEFAAALSKEEVTPEYRALTLRCVAIKPTERPSMKEITAELEKMVKKMMAAVAVVPKPAEKPPG